MREDLGYLPILGDRLYGCRAAATRLHLHARELRFQHPQSGESLHLRVKTLKVTSKDTESYE